MSAIEERVEELRAQGLCCSQVVMTLAGPEDGTENKALVRAMKGLGYGMYAQHACGSLLGGACALALRLDAVELKRACRELSEWFENRFGGVNCRDILGPGGAPTIVCSETMAETAEKCLEILEESGH